MDCKSILVVEDDADIRESVEEVLQMEGYDVASCANGEEAIRVLGSIYHTPLILLDLMMPVMNGWAFLDALRAIPKFAQAPVVLVSALPEGRAFLPATGLIQAEGLLRKPLDVDSLLKVVEKYCVPARVASEMTESQTSAMVNPRAVPINTSRG